MKTILVVCTGNICRSPLVAGLLTRYIETANLAGQLVVKSAGTGASPGMGASGHSVTVLARKGIDISDHSAQRLTYDLIQEADLILVMEEAHRSHIFYQSPENLDKVLLLSELAGLQGDIADPIGQDEAAYRRTLREVENILVIGWPRLLQRLGIEDA
ncbi:MAG: hypothetical protein R3A44_41775 [Caldilineaceae bacterium]